MANDDLFEDSKPSLTTRRILSELDDQLESDEIISLKFLCNKLLSASKLEKINRGIHLFDNLELLWGFKTRNEPLDPNFVRNIAELMYLIRRNDLLRILGYNVKRIKMEIARYGSNIDSFWKLLFCLSDVTSGEFEVMKSMSKPHLSSSDYEKIQSAQALFEVLYRQEDISKDDLSLLETIFTLIKRTDLLSDVKDFKCTDIETVKPCTFSNFPIMEKLVENDEDLINKKNYVIPAEKLPRIQDSSQFNGLFNYSVLREPCTKEKEAKRREEKRIIGNKVAEENAVSTPENSNIPLSVIAASSPTIHQELSDISSSPQMTPLIHNIQACPETGGDQENIYQYQEILTKIWWVEKICLVTQ